MFHHDPAHLWVAQHARQLSPLPVESRADFSNHVEVLPTSLPGKRLKALHLTLQVSVLVGARNPRIKHRWTMRVGFLNENGAGGKLPGSSGQLAHLEPPLSSDIADPLLADPVGELHSCMITQTATASSPYT